MRIVHSVSALQAYGIGEVVQAIARRESQQGFDVTIAAFRFDAEPPPHCRKLLLDNSLKVRPAKLANILNEYDVVHHHQSSAINVALQYVRAQRVLHYHGVSPKPGILPRLRVWNERRTLRKAVRDVDRIIALTRCGRDELTQQLGAETEKITIIPNGVDLDVFRIDSSEARDDKGLLFVGSLILAKRVDVLLRAVALLHARGERVRLRVAGDGPLRPGLAKLAEKLGIADSVEFLGYVPHEALPSVYARASVYVSASEYEMFPLPVIEAAACGKPSVLSDCCPHKELVSEGNLGQVFRCGDPSGAAEAISRLLSKQWSYAPLRAYAEDHSWDALMPRITSLYGTLELG